MKKKIIIGLIFILLIAAYVGIYFYTLNDKADMVVYGNIYTGVDGKTTEAIAIKNKKFIYVGNKKDVKKYIDKDTKIYKYNDKTVISGFTDTHTHVSPSFSLDKNPLDLTMNESIDEYVETIKKYVEENPDKEMYTGRGWDASLFENETPTKEILDAIVPDKPIFIKSADGHSGWVNSKMIELMGVTSSTKDPAGGIIDRDENGNPVGCFRDLAMDVFIKPNLTPNTVEQYKKQILKAQKFYAELGYSSYVEVFVEADATNYNIYKAYEELDKEGKLILRVQGAWNVMNSEDSLDEVKKIIKYKEESKGGMFELTDIKIFMDGVAETKTAYFSEPYTDDPTTSGADRWPGEEGFNRLVDCIVLANQNDVVVHFHAIGDAATTKALDALEKARSIYTNKKIHNVITHLESVKESDIKRFKELDVVVAANLAWGYKNPDIYDSVEVKRLGEERAENAYPYKSLLDSGAVVSMATDYPAGVVCSPIAAYIVAVNRNATDDPALIRNEKEKMTIDEALTALTYGGAYQMRQENYRGTIEVGKYADFAVFDADLLEPPTFDTVYTETLLNVVDGKVVYENK